MLIHHLLAIQNTGSAADYAIDAAPLQNVSSEDPILAAARQRINTHLRSLEAQAENEHEADTSETVRMYRELTKPAPKLDWWVLLFVPLLLLAAGYLIGGKEIHAS